VDRRQRGDRFGTTDADEFVHFRYLLRKWGCRLYDAAGTDWTRKDIATVITAVVDGEKSEQEQHGISKRTLGGKVAKARAGEWQGGPVRLGFDVVCCCRQSGKEVWRVVFQGRHKRLKVYPDGRSERFDGPANFPKWQSDGKPTAQLLRLAPTIDRAKIDAAVTVFSRYAAESLSFTVLAHYLNDLGFRNGGGGYFQGQQIEDLLRDPIYLGYYAYNRLHVGKFHRYAGQEVVAESNHSEKISSNDKADWVISRRLFPPLVDQKTWDAVQRKLEQRTKRSKSPRAAALYLAGLVYCGNCGGRMVAGAGRKNSRNGDRYEYMCGTYQKAVCRGTRKECQCLRNGVFQDVLEGYVNRYLEESGQRLQLLTEAPDDSHLTDRLAEQEGTAWQGFVEGIGRLTGYLAQHHPDDYAAILDQAHRRAAEDRQAEDGPAAAPGSLLAHFGQRLKDACQADRGDATPSHDDFVADCLASYRSLHDPAALEADITRLETEHSEMYRRYADLPTPRAQAKAKAELLEVEARIAELERQREDAASVVEQCYREMHDLQQAIANAKLAMASETGDRALRQRAEALRAVIQRIECTFTATGQSGRGYGKASSRLSAVTIYPVVGDPAAFSATSKGTIMYSNAHSFM
jgi:hypothetical protein